MKSSPNVFVTRCEFCTLCLGAFLCFRIGHLTGLSFRRHRGSGTHPLLGGGGEGFQEGTLTGGVGQALTHFGPFGCRVGMGVRRRRSPSQRSSPWGPPSAGSSPSTATPSVRPNLLTPLTLATAVPEPGPKMSPHSFSKFYFYFKNTNKFARRQNTSHYAKMREITAQYLKLWKPMWTCFALDDAK